MKTLDSLPFRQLGNSLLTLASFVYFGFLLVRNVFDPFPAVKTGGWLLLVAGFLLVVPSGITPSDYLVRLTGIPEGRAEWLAVLTVMGLLALTVYSFRDLMAPWFQPG